MIRGLPWLLVAALAATLGAVLWRPEAVTARLGLGELARQRQEALWEAQMRAHQRRLDAATPPGAVVFVGDSYVQGLNASTVRACTANFGIGGETAHDLPVRLAGLGALDRAAAVVVMTGLNDVVSGRDSMLADSYDRVLAELPADRPVLVTTLPRLAPGSTHAFAVVRGSGAARAACRRRANCRVVDLAAAMVEPAALLEGDGLHLNPAGYAVWARLLREALDAAGVPDRGCAR